MSTELLDLRAELLFHCICAPDFGSEYWRGRVDAILTGAFGSHCEVADAA